MLRIAPKAIAYHGWQIKIVMQNGAFFFHCYPPDVSEFCNNGAAYITFRDAVAAARHFINREVAIKALLDIVDEWLQDGRVDEEEYWSLTNFD